MFNQFAKDIATILPQSFSAYERTRKCLSNESTKIIYDIVCASELSLLCLKDENTDLHTSTKIIFENKTYFITQIEKESRIMLRIFLKKGEDYAYTK